jgi:transcription antitermination factor NusG
MSTLVGNKRVWRAIYVSSRSEKKIMGLLNARGLEAWVPLVKSMRQWSDRKKMVEFPLLNGYVFVYVNDQEQEQVVQNKGVVGFVRIEGKIATVRDEEVFRLKQLVELGYHMEASIALQSFKSGEKVKITSGALNGIEGYVTEDVGGKLIEVFLDSIRYSIRVRLPREILVQGK